MSVDNEKKLLSSNLKMVKPERQKSLWIENERARGLDNVSRLFASSRKLVEMSQI